MYVLVKRGTGMKMAANPQGIIDLAVRASAEQCVAQSLDLLSPFCEAMFHERLRLCSSTRGPLCYRCISPEAMTSILWTGPDEHYWPLKEATHL